MKITRIEEMTGSRSRVFIDGEFAFVLYRGELRTYHIVEGQELSMEDHDAILTQVLPRRAKLRAMNLLKNREYTEKQLRDKLCEGGYPEQIVEEALSYVESFHYIDDLRYATAYITCHEDTRSRRRIQQDLLGRGIAPDLLEEAWREWEEQGGSGDMIRRRPTEKRNRSRELF